MPEDASHRIVPDMTALTLAEAQRTLPEAARKALTGEAVTIQVGGETLRLVQDVPMRPPGFFTDCYRDASDAAFEERVCHDSKPVLEE